MTTFRLRVRDDATGYGNYYVSHRGELMAAQRWPYAFACRHEAAEHLPNGGGWTECFRVPIEERPQLLALAEV